MAQGLFETLGEGLEVDYQKKIFGVAPGDFEIKSLLRLLEEQDGRLLDIGCGLGKLTKAVKKSRPDLEVYGCDIGKEAIRMAKKDPQGVYFIIGKSDRLPFKNGFFDAVYARHVLEHLDELDAAMVEIRRVLKKNGYFYSVTPLEGSPVTLEYWSRKIKFIRQAREKYTGHVSTFSFRGLKEIIEKNRFLVKNYFFGEFFLYQSIDCLYFPLLVFLKKDFSFSFRGNYIVARKSGFKRWLALTIKTALEEVFKAENIFWQKLRVPGFIVYIRAVKT